MAETYLYQIVCAIFFLLLCRGGTHIKAAKCRIDEYGVKLSDGKISCRPCSDLHKCPHGMGVSIACGGIAPHGTHVQCVHCVLGRNYSAHYDKKPCQSCQSVLCHKNEKVLGKCLLYNDNSTCSGTCEKGFYPIAIDNSLDGCQPCSACHNGSLTQRVEKCKEDGLPVDKQCEVGVLPLFTLKNVPRPSEKNEYIKGHEDQEVYKVYGHPALFISLLVVIVVLLSLLAWSHKKKCRRKPQPNTSSPEEAPLNDVRVDCGVDETDSYDGTTDLNSVQPNVRQRKPSTSSSGRKVSFGRQHSNSGSDFSDERNLQSGTPAGEMSGETGAVEKNTLQIPGQKQTSSGSSGPPGKRVHSYNRQISNPVVSENKEERPFHKRRMTVSSFPSIISGAKGTTEETTPILQSSDCDDNEVFSMVALPPKTRSSAASHRLAGVKIGKINAEIYRQLCGKLNTDLLDNDWKTLAGRMDYDNELVKRFEKEKDPADKLLEYWGTQEGNDVAKLLELVREMGRNDVVMLLEKV